MCFRKNGGHNPVLLRHCKFLFASLIPLTLTVQNLVEAVEALVGSVHFEGRLCEELLRLSSDGVLRCFTPYDCEKPRVSVHATEILQIESIPGLFLGRFFLWQVWNSHISFFFVGGIFCVGGSKSMVLEPIIIILLKALLSFLVNDGGAYGPEGLRVLLC